MKKILLTILLAVFLLPQFAHADITSNLEAWYKCNEGTGTTVSDSTGNGHTGTMQGTATWLLPGKIGAAACSYSGVNSGNGTSITRFGSYTTFTYAGWIYIPTGTVNSFANLMSNDSGTGIWVLNDKIDFDNGGTHSSATTITRDTWHHVAVVQNAGSVTFYLDGNSDGTASVAGAQFFNGMACDGGTGGECFKNYHDDVRLYTRALSGADISELYLYTEAAATVVKPRVNVQSQVNVNSKINIQ